jgi:hypothetical protein
MEILSTLHGTYSSLRQVIFFCEILKFRVYCCLDQGMLSKQVTRSIGREIKGKKVPSW